MSKRKCIFFSELKAKYTCFEGVDDSKYVAFCSVRLKFLLEIKGNMICNNTLNQRNISYVSDP